MRIRDMKLEDYEAVDGLMQDLHRLHVQGRPDLYVDLEHPYSLQEYKEKVESDDVISILAEEEGKVLGICFVILRKRSMMVNMITAYMDDLCVKKEAQRKGIATALFQRAEEEAVARGAKRLDLMVWEFNQGAVEFYKSLGMTEQRYILEKKL